MPPAFFVQNYSSSLVNCYITTLIKMAAEPKIGGRIGWLAEPKPTGEGWSPWSDSHRRIRVYETRPVAAEGTGALKIGALTWNCTTNLRLRRAACRDSLYLESGKFWHPWPDPHRLGTD